MQTSLFKVVSAPTAGSMRLPENRALAIQVVMRSPKMFWVTKPVIMKNPPVTAERPTPRLAEWRYVFAMESSKWKGAKGVGTLEYDSRSKKHRKGDLVLNVQATAQRALKAAAGKLTRPHAATYDPATGRYRSYIRYRRHTPAELAELAAIAPPKV